MKLRNKRTGEIADLSEGFIKDTYNGEMIQIKPVAISNKEGYVYGSLAALNEEWEDYEEPKDHYYIDYDGDIMIVEALDYEPKIKEMKQIGNYFETREEAEKAVEKLKAWKRLKEAGYCFTPDAIEEESKHYYILRLGCEKEKIMKTVSECRSNYRDLIILFGDEE